MRRHLTWCVLLVGFVATSVLADPPAAMYIFPAGGQRGTEVKVRVGGMYLHESAPWEVLGPGVTASPRLAQTETIWFEGPVIPLPDSQQSEDYPKDYLGTIQIEPNATAAARAWRIWTAQGATPARTFVLGDLPEIVEEEIDGRPVAVPVVAPITINGRIFPREDVDVWSINAKPGESFTCTALGASLGSPLEVRLEVRDPNGLAIAESSAVPLPDCDASVRFVAPVAGNYSVRIHDLRFGGLQHYVYRLTITNGPYVDHLFPLGGRRGTTTEFHLAGQKVPDKPIPLQLPVEGSQTQAQFSLPSGNSNRVILDLDEFPEIVERLDRRGTEPAATPQAVPFVANGRIASPGETDVWPVSLKKGEVIQLETRAARLGTPIDTVMSIADAAGKELAQNDDLAGGISDSALAFTAPEEGVYLVRVTERDPDRGGPTFAYRLRVTSASRPDFRLFLTENAVALTRGGEVKLKVRVERTGGYAGEIIPEIIGNLEGVTVTAPPIAANVNELQISLKTDALAKVAAGRLEVRGTALIGD
ncbi:MAG: PPC domain-containing protein, partial [Planctomycetota bacterium]|nr:PPC domain-containing protein [Planctomycetota bacterium]